jgi:hypothetical protein
MTVLTPFFRKVLIVDAATSASAGFLLIGGADLMTGLLSLPSGLLFWSGVALIPFVATLVMVVRAKVVPAGVLPAIIAINFAWIAGSLFVAFGPMFAPTIIGKVFVCVQAAAVFLFAELQVTGLRRASATA